MAAPSAPPKQWGISPPMSTALPEPNDNEKTAELIEELKRENNYEPLEATQKRMSTLALLNRVTQEFVREVSRRQRLPPSQIDQFGGKILTYGSYRLGVFGPGSDIDTLAVAPRHVTREDFFELFPVILKRMTEDGEVTSLTPVPDSYVPIIKLEINDIEIDLIFASIASLHTIPKNLTLNDNNLLTGLDQATVRAVTGPRVTDEILNLVPEQKTFRTALRAIKLWAQRRAVYANIVGYPGGVAWAMLVARVCQLYPHAVGATVVNKFFFVIKGWPWPTPVMLKHIEHPKGSQANEFKVWNPSIYKGDGKMLMPIITPAFPSMSATYNISKSGKTIILRELERGSQITNRILSGKARWSDLFKKHTFFTADHKYYLGVTASTLNADSAKQWAGLVESKVRIFVMLLEGIKDITLARPFTKGFKRVHRCTDDSQIREVQKGSMKYKVEETKTVETTDPELVTSNGGGAAVPAAVAAQPENDRGAYTVYTYTFYIGIDTTAKGSLNIAPSFQNFKDICEGWTSFNRDAHFLTLASIKCWDLPDDVFDTKAGEVKPSKPVKKVMKPSKVETKPAVRRSINEVEGGDEANGAPAKRQRLMTPTPTPTPTPTAALA
ncbi:polynucleotide adenylyltransferase [Exophiala xenobiotica]|nr:polynucleotide adenylyltransferase [Exophiala xenobiotica]KAK5238459.1 polynucleotide adenylyltransferase [Exophiala xenobiotica]KAK5245085.1 polynucleotide adenylyltransferase [Exophiala xenobiotica]KAK5349816.1 polynucleotide adenylyltransferase [Exophiala xenobiotica]KAK5387266.1 polynucleotide adenylyltransferase [Exophiala xenobiotica]